MFMSPWKAPIQHHQYVKLKKYDSTVLKKFQAFVVVTQISSLKAWLYPAHFTALCYGGREGPSFPVIGPLLIIVISITNISDHRYFHLRWECEFAGVEYCYWSGRSDILRTSIISKCSLSRQTWAEDLALHQVRVGRLSIILMSTSYVFSYTVC